MGDRYILTVKCVKCGEVEEDVYYAPTCGFTEWKCPKCGHVTDLAEFTGISYKEASNLDKIKKLVDEIKEDKRRQHGG